MGLKDKFARRINRKIDLSFAYHSSMLVQWAFRAAGIQHFEWITQEDARVRPLHQTLHGKTFPVATGHPTEGFPGQPFGCRCEARPVFAPGRGRGGGSFLAGLLAGALAEAFSGGEENEPQNA